MVDDKFPPSLLYLLKMKCARVVCGGFLHAWSQSALERTDKYLQEQTCHLVVQGALFCIAANKKVSKRNTLRTISLEMFVLWLDFGCCATKTCQTATCCAGFDNAECFSEAVFVILQYNETFEVKAGHFNLRGSYSGCLVTERQVQLTIKGETFIFTV